MGEALMSKMEQPFEKIMNSRYISVVIGGKDGIRFFAHAAALAQLSPAIDSLIKSEIEKWQEARVFLEDLDRETFILVSEFAYTGDYTLPTPAKLPSGETGKEVVAPSLAVMNASDEDDSFVQVRGFDKETGVKIPPNELEDIYGPVLLIQGKAYSFTNKWGIQRLQYLVYRRLTVTLQSYKLNHTNIGDVIGLIRYIWREDLPEDDLLKQVLLDYVVSKATMFSAHEAFMDLLARGGVFAKELWRKLLESKQGSQA